MRSHCTTWALGLASLVLVSACGGTDSDDPAGSAGVEVMASFYPLEWVSQRVAGDRAAVRSLTPPGAEPHDLELTPQDVAEMTEADLVVYLAGFQPAVDEAVAVADESMTVDAAALTSLDLEVVANSAEQAEEEGSVDPHFWLDPMRLAQVGDAMAEELTAADADAADVYAQNAADLRADLEALDQEMSAGLDNCASTTLVTSHQAFGYLADRYGFAQLGISGLSPEDEPSPTELAEVTDFVSANDVDTIYFETLVSPDVAQTVADETGASTATLDPLEGLTEDSAGADYLEVMRANLAVMQEGQSCT